MTDIERERDHFKSACHKMNDEICQILGKALGYPRFCDDKANFPDATEEDGVFVGEHVAESIAEEAVENIRQLQETLDDIMWENQNKRTSIGSRKPVSWHKDRVIKFLQQHGPSARKDIMEKAYIPAGSLSVILRSPEFESIEHGIWKLKDQQ